MVVIDSVDRRFRMEKQVFVDLVTQISRYHRINPVLRSQTELSI